jgi:predicted kinase
MEAVLLIGVQGSGKTTFSKRHFFETHVRVSRDMLRTRRRERLLVAACLAARQSYVVDNTNALASRRAEHIAPAKAAGFRVVGFFFRCELRDALARNRQRPAERVVPPAGVAGTWKKLQPPSWSEGFDELHVVEIAPSGEFLVREWERGEEEPPGA